MQWQLNLPGKGNKGKNSNYFYFSQNFDPTPTAESLLTLDLNFVSLIFLITNWIRMILLFILIHNWYAGMELVAGCRHVFETQRRLFLQNGTDFLSKINPGLL